MRGLVSSRKFITKKWTTMFERWGIANRSGLMVRDNFGRFVVSASLKTSGQGGDANGAVELELGAAEVGFYDVMADMEAMA